MNKVQVRYFVLNWFLLHNSNHLIRLILFPAQYSHDPIYDDIS